MSITLYSGPLSLFTAKVRIALAEKGLAYEKITVGWSLKDRYLPHHPEVARLNPKAEVPVLVEGDAIVYDSTVILEYLDERHPEPPLYPKDVVQRARCRQLEAEADEIIFPYVWDLIEETLYPAGERGRDTARADAARAGLQTRFEALDQQLDHREYLCGEFSVADIGTFIMANAATSLGFEPEKELGALGAWSERMRARPVVGAEVAEMVEYLGKALAAG